MCLTYLTICLVRWTEVHGLYPSQSCALRDSEHVLIILVVLYVPSLDLK